MRQLKFQWPGRVGSQEGRGKGRQAAGHKRRKANDDSVDKDNDDDDGDDGDAHVQPYAMPTAEAAAAQPETEMHAGILAWHPHTHTLAHTQMRR